jgi:hypothetical protein
MIGWGQCAVLARSSRFSLSQGGGEPLSHVPILR